METSATPTTQPSVSSTAELSADSAGIRGPHRTQLPQQRVDIVKLKPRYAGILAPSVMSASARSTTCWGRRGSKQALDEIERLRSHFTSIELMTVLRGHRLAVQRDQIGGATVSNTGSDAEWTKTA